MTQVVTKQRIICQFISPGSLRSPESRSTLFLQSRAVTSTGMTTQPQVKPPWTLHSLPKLNDG